MRNAKKAPLAITLTLLATVALMPACEDDGSSSGSYSGSGSSSSSSSGLLDSSEQSAVQSLVESQIQTMVSMTAASKQAAAQMDGNCMSSPDCPQAQVCVEADVSTDGSQSTVRTFMDGTPVTCEMNGGSVTYEQYDFSYSSWQTESGEYATEWSGGIIMSTASSGGVNGAAYWYNEAYIVYDPSTGVVTDFGIDIEWTNFSTGVGTVNLVAAMTGSNPLEIEGTVTADGAGAGTFTYSGGSFSWSWM